MGTIPESSPPLSSSSARPARDHTYTDSHTLVGSSGIGSLGTSHMTSGTSHMTSGMGHMTSRPKRDVASRYVYSVEPL